MPEILWAVIRTNSGFRPLPPGRANKWPIQCFCAGGEEQAKRLCKTFEEDEGRYKHSLDERMSGRNRNVDPEVSEL